MDMSLIIYLVSFSILFVSLLLLYARLRDKTPKYTISKPRRKRLQHLSIAASLSFAVEVGLFTLQFGFQLSRGVVLYDLVSILLWTSVSILLRSARQPSWPAYVVSWAIGAAVDAVMLRLPLLSRSLRDGWDIAHLAVHTCRIAIFVGAIYGYCSLRRRAYLDAASDEETRNLLGDPTACVTGDVDSTSTITYGSISEPRIRSQGRDGSQHSRSDDDYDDDDDDDDDDEEEEEDKEMKKMQKKRLKENGGWFGYLKGFLIFLPYILPYNDRPTQLWLLIMFICIIIERFFTIMIPLQLGVITEALSKTLQTGELPWKEILIWGLLQFPVEAGVQLLMSMARTRISQYAYRQLKDIAFAHVMSLSMDYHTSKSTGKVTKAIEQGTDLTMILDSAMEAAPVLVDLVVAVVYLTSYFDAVMGGIVAATAVTHLCITLKGYGYTASLERRSSEKSRGENEVLYDSISNWQTVAYHNRSKFEQERYKRSVWANLLSMRRYEDASNYVYTMQKFIVDAGLMSACYVAASRVADGTVPTSSFVFLVAYWRSISGPIDILSWSFHETAARLINAEWLYQLLQTKPSVQDKKGARPLQIKAGKVEFANVSFAYNPQRPILQDVSFVAESGQSIALVGETGGGKSSLLRLLWRFYDVTNGSIMIDGQDVRDITLESLRDSLGSVPQDPSVFDQNIMENILYARPGVAEDDVYAACKAACIHEQIMRFPDKYHSKIGERGVRLSGGELQRLAIARVILRQPRIVVLDEATSAVDSGTEASVQQAIRALSAGRTVFTVAHRLSTVVGADVILVIDQGRIVERGSHKELLALGGKYSRLWAMQTVAR